MPVGWGVGGEGDDGAGQQGRLDLGEGSDEESELFGGPVGGAADEDDAWAGVLAEGEEFAKIGVDGDDDAVVAPGDAHDVGVGGPEEASLREMDGLMTLGAKELRHGGRK
jgi:hypothetical protein